MRKNDVNPKTRTIGRSQILQFYLWSLKQCQNYRTMGCAAIFTYLTDFRSLKSRPFLKTGLTDAGVVAAKRKRGEVEVLKVRTWSKRLRCVAAKALQREDESIAYLFSPARKTAVYTRHGWASSWKDAMLAWIKTRDTSVTERSLTMHFLYFNLQDIRPTAITQKLPNRDKDAYDFAAHVNPATTHQHYDQRVTKTAEATE